jgi:hypothetical protein
MNKPDEPISEQGITVVCCRGHQQHITTKAPIFDDAVDEETNGMKCPTCGALPMYLTDGQYMRGFNRTPVVRSTETVERYK